MEAMEWGVMIVAIAVKSLWDRKTETQRGGDDECREGQMMVGDGDGKGITSICKVTITFLPLLLSILCHHVGVFEYL